MQTAGSWIAAIQLHAVPIAGEDQHAQQRQPEDAKRQVRFEESVVGLVWMPPVLAPQILKPWSEEEAFEPGTQPWIDAEAQQIRPQIGSSGQVCFPTGRLDDEREGGWEHVRDRSDDDEARNHRVSQPGTRSPRETQNH